MPKTPDQPPGPDPVKGAEDTPQSPHPLQHPDERKEGGPDFGKAERQAEKHERDAKNATHRQHPRLRRKPGPTA